MYESFRELSLSRHSTREFSETKVPQDRVEKILELAATSPYASVKSNWDIKVIDDPQIIKEIASRVKEYTDELTPKIRDDFRDGFMEYSKSFVAFEDAPLILIPTFKVNYSLSLMVEDEDIKNWERESYVKSISCLSMIIHQTAHSLGLGSCYMTGPVIAQEAIKQIIKVKPRHDIAAIIPIGFKKEK
ncbi:MAG: nitroreductase family protein [Campylobacterota bacterium]|nr:nitroreductase family protein [Campylobacterota bacterium]